MISALGGAAVAWPLAAPAQQPALPVVGFLRSTSLAPFENLVLAFGEGLKQAGFVDGENVKIEYRYAENQRDRLPALVADLTHLPVAVLVVNSGAAAAAKAATTTIPIVFAAGADPVKDGLVASLNRPGGNMTGVTWLGSQVGAKRLELLRQIVPQATVIGMLEHSASPLEARRNERTLKPPNRQSVCNSSSPTSAVTATSRPPSPISFNAAPAHSLSAPARS